MIKSKTKKIKGWAIVNKFDEILPNTFRGHPGSSIQSVLPPVFDGWPWKTWDECKKQGMKVVAVSLQERKPTKRELNFNV